jgi:hypothetical protein
LLMQAKSVEARMSDQSRGPAGLAILIVIYFI